MIDINDKFTSLLKKYSGIFNTTQHTCTTCEGLRGQIPKGVTGVYIVKEARNDGRIVYIGSAGKIHKGMTVGGSSIHKRMFYSSTPYRFDKIKNTFCYGPTTTSVPPAGYKFSISVGNIIVLCIDVASPFAPSALEHLLIQGHITEFGDLPVANQKI